MRFEARELTPYANPVRPEELVVGEYYFQLTFIDDEMCIPCMNPIVYVGSNILQGDLGQLYFQDVDSYRAGLRHGEGRNDEIMFHFYDENSINNVFEFEDALEGLMCCSLKRKKAADK